jgi:hypothetical protein
MSCTCFQRKYPCPVHAPGRLQQIPEYQSELFIINIYVKWTDKDEKSYYATVTKDGVRVFTSEILNSRDEAMAKAVEFISKPLTADKVVAKL